MKSIVNLRRVQTTSRRQHRLISQQRLSNRCDALCQEITQLKCKLAKEKEDSANLKKVVVQLCRDSAEARDWVGQDKLLQDKLDKFNKAINDEISQSQENFKAELKADREKNRLLQEKLHKKREFYESTSEKNATATIDAIKQVHKIQRDLENCVQQNKELEGAYQFLCCSHNRIMICMNSELHKERETNRLLNVSYEKTAQDFTSQISDLKIEIEDLWYKLKNGAFQHQVLQKDYDELRFAHNEINQRYATDGNNARHELDNLLRELQYGVQQHKGLQKAYEELRAAHMVSQENFTAELDEERQKNMLLQEELQKTRVSYNEISQRYTTDANNARHELDNLLQEVENGVQQQQGPQKNFKAELDEERQKNLLLQEELQKTCVSYNEISQKYTTEACNARNHVDNLLRELQYGVQQNKSLQKAYEELCAAYKFSQKNFTAELHAERQKNMLLQEELQKTRVSYNGISQRHSTYISLDTDVEMECA